MTTPKNRTEPANILQRRSFWIIGAVILVAVVSYAAFTNRGPGETIANVSTYKVQEGPLTISVTEPGTIQPRERVVIKNELEGRTTILFLVPEGAQVKKGDLVAELDASTLQDSLVNQQIQVQNADASFVSAKENLAVVKSQAASDVAQAELDLEFAIQDLEKYKKGEYPTQLKEAEAKITLAEESLTQREEALKWSEILYKEKYISQSELKENQLAEQRTKLDLEMAEAAKQLLEDYTYKRQIRQLESDVEQAKMALERTEGKAAASIVQAEADLQAKDSEFKQQVSKLKKLEDQIGKAKIFAPIDGQVVYATSMRAGWRGNEEPLREGQEIRERQELIHLPTTSSYMAEVKVHESNLEKIRLGLPVRVIVDAIPGKMYYGRVGKIAPLPDAQSAFMNPDLKIYNSEIHIEGDGQDLRSGMTCRAEIVVDHFDKALFAPVQSVVRVGGQPTIYVQKGNEFVPTPIEIGLDNNRMVQIKEGVKPGDIVSMSPPLAASSMASTAGQIDAELTNRIEQARSAPPPVAPSEAGGGPGGFQDGPGGFRGGQGGPGGGDGSQFGGGRRGGRGEGQGRGGGEGQGRGGFGNMTEEEMAERRKQFENMTPEQREEMSQRFRQMRNQSGGDGGAPQQ